MTTKLPNDQTLWFRNLPPKASDGGSEEVQGNAGKEPEIELFIEPLTGLAIPMPNQNKGGVCPPFSQFNFGNFAFLAPPSSN
jgi:hypothetical protein